MEISKAELDAKIESFIEAEQEKYEAGNGISCNYTPFCFVAKHGDQRQSVYRTGSFPSKSQGALVEEEYKKVEQLLQLHSQNKLAVK